MTSFLSNGLKNNSLEFGIRLEKMIVELKSREG
jgi:hypothetical protein